MLFRDDLLKLCQSGDASLDHSSWRGKGRRGGQVKKREGRVAKKSLTNLSTGLGNV